MCYSHDTYNLLSISRYREQHCKSKCDVFKRIRACKLAEALFTRFSSFWVVSFNLTRSDVLSEVTRSGEEHVEREIQLK